jgi:multiple sugar transport system ATP-binding protein
VAQIALRNLGKKFGNVTAIKDITLEIRDREFFVLLGPTGAGKTTTLRCIAGLEKPENGDVLIDNQSVITWSPAERDVALVFQYYSLYPHYTVKQNLEFPLKSKIRNTPPEEIKEKVTRVAETLRIEPLLERTTETLSGGEMQRVAIGRAIVRDPRIFLMDEPLSNIDAKLRETLRAELKSLQMNLGATFLYVTHDQVEAMTMGERIGVLNKGEIIQIGTPYEVYNNPKNTFVATFVGTPAMNLFNVTIHKDRVIVTKDVFEFDLEPRISERIKGISGEVTIGIRSEGIPIQVEKGIVGHIYGIENMGMERIVTLKVEDRLFRATVDAKLNVGIDSEVQFTFDQDQLHFFDKESGESLFHN